MITRLLFLAEIIIWSMVVIIFLLGRQCLSQSLLSFIIAICRITFLNKLHSIPESSAQPFQAVGLCFMFPHCFYWQNLNSTIQVTKSFNANSLQDSLIRMSKMAFYAHTEFISKFCILGVSLHT